MKHSMITAYNWNSRYYQIRIVCLADLKIDFNEHSYLNFAVVKPLFN